MTKHTCQKQPGVYLDDTDIPTTTCLCDKCPASEYATSGGYVICCVNCGEIKMKW